MPRLPRNALPPYGAFHITARGVDRCRIYRDTYDYRFFYVIFKRYVDQAELDVRAFCCMPNHYHALIEGKLESISWTLHRVHTIHCQAFNDRHGRSGHLLQSRFGSKLVKDEEHLGSACEYIWNNPVRAGLCATAADWPWSGQLRLPSRVERREPISWPLQETCPEGP